MFLIVLFVVQAAAQEIVVPLTHNPAYDSPDVKPFKSKTQRASLPFIDDFSYQGPYPDASLWQDNKAYINNTMSASPLTRGVATLDGLNQYGRPYFAQPYNSGLADSLTSVPIDLSSYTNLDSIYLSFFYQPQGLGFAPESGDSLFLYFKNNLNQWVRMWQVRGTPLQGFKIVVLPVMDAQYLHSGFQFRFVNIASLNINDDVWNLDYVKMAVKRTETDTVMKDVAFSVEPSSILKNYSSMPYRHFIANQSNELSSSQAVFINNLDGTPHAVIPALTAKEFISSSAINTQTLPSVTIAAKSYMQETFMSYPINYVAPTNTSKVVLRNTYYYPPVSPTDRKANDTIVKDAVFDNYFAYDDGSAEKAYFLLPAINYPSKTALQFKLNEADTLRGLMVHFGAQVPAALGKYFSIVLYKSLGSNGIPDSIIAQEDLLRVQYEPSYNGFSSYAFSSPTMLDSGTYYIGITQPANFGSDSIYYGLDVNTNTSLQHLAYNVDGTWFSSTISGSVMMRPIVGQHVIPTAVSPPVKIETADLQLFPNPVQDLMYVTSSESYTSCRIYSINGELLRKAAITNHSIDLHLLNPGTYILTFTDAKGTTISKKINKY